MTDVSAHPSNGKLTSRQCPRRPVRLQFNIGGLDHEGRFFEEIVTTKDISDCGGCFCSHRILKVGTTLRLSGPHGFISMIRIAWMGKRPDTEGHDFGFVFVNPLEN